MTDTQRPSDQQLVATYQSNRQALQSMISRIGELERDADEHSLVIDTLQDMPAGRKCFRMIDQVLVEQTVEKVLPQLKTTHEKIKDSLGAIGQSYAQKEKEQAEFTKRYNIQITRS